MPNLTPVTEYGDTTYLSLRIHGKPLTLTLSPEYRGEGNDTVITLRFIPAVITFAHKILLRSEMDEKF